MTNQERSIKILGLWGEINGKHKQIEDLQLKIGKLKDDILILQQEIIEVQDDVDSSENGTYIPSGRMS